MESATIDENLPTSAEESIVKFSHELSSKYDERPVVVNVRLVPPVCGPVVGDIVQVEDSSLLELSVLSSRRGVGETIGEITTLSIVATNKQEINTVDLADSRIKSSKEFTH